MPVAYAFAVITTTTQAVAEAAGSLSDLIGNVVDTVVGFVEDVVDTVASTFGFDNKNSTVESHGIDADSTDTDGDGIGTDGSGSGGGFDGEPGMGL